MSASNRGHPTDVRAAVHLGRGRRCVVMLNAIDGLVRLRVFQHARDVAEPQEIAIAKQRPTRVAGKKRGEKSRIGELR